MTYRLTEGSSPTATRVDVTSDINLAGSLAQFSKGAVMQEVANRITAEFVRNFEQALSVAPGQAHAGAAGSAAPINRSTPAICSGRSSGSVSLRCSGGADLELPDSSNRYSNAT